MKIIFPQSYLIRFLILFSASIIIFLVGNLILNLDVLNIGYIFNKNLFPEDNPLKSSNLIYFILYLFCCLILCFTIKHKFKNYRNYIFYYCFIYTVIYTFIGIIYFISEMWSSYRFIYESIVLALIGILIGFLDLIIFKSYGKNQIKNKKLSLSIRSDEQ